MPLRSGLPSGMRGNTAAAAPLLGAAGGTGGAQAASEMTVASPSASAFIAGDARSPD
jgi:hypothetical protein